MEKEICIDSARKAEAQYIRNRLDELLIPCTTSESNKFIRFSVTLTHSTQLAFRNLLHEIILTERKHEYIVSALNVKDTDYAITALISSLVYFDRAQEESQLGKILANMRVYNIDGIFNFCLGRMTEDWDELIELSSSLLSMGCSDADIYNITEFMMSPRMSEDKSIFIASVSEQLITNVTKGGLIDVLKLYKDAERNMINAIVSECPGEVIIERETVDEDFIKTIKNLVKVKII